MQYDAHIWAWDAWVLERCIAEIEAILGIESTFDHASIMSLRTNPRGWEYAG